MPNNIKNILRVEGEPGEVARFFADIHGGYDDYDQEIYMDFNKIIPMPPSLAIESGTRTTQGLEMYQGFMQESAALATLGVTMGRADSTAHLERVATLIEKYDKMQAARPDTWNLGKQAFENLAQHGATTWYDWCCQNWGTKWNAYEQARCGDGEISFQTAWSGVRDLMEQVIVQYPDLHFEYSYADEHIGYNVAQFEYEHGECVCEHVPNSGTPEARKLAAQIWNLDLSAEMDMLG